ncbi:MAG TPA: adenylosuccinate synthase [Armatimonadota bacterium]|jgi:adenylosuccinate synthase
MPAVVVVGAQWGDEAKGKVVDLLSQRADVAVRFNGGPNAGHRVLFGGQVFAQHLVPSGIFNPRAVCVIADGVVIEPLELIGEIDGLASRGIDVSNLKLSPNAHLVLECHRQQDRLEEARRGAFKIGTTGRGVGPAYADKAARTGLRVGDLVDPERFTDRFRHFMAEKNELLTKVFGAEPLDVEGLLQQYLAAGERLRSFVADTREIVIRAVETNQRVVFEGAQGMLLDIDYGTYPFVTSSHPVAGGACLGTGIGPRSISRVVGVVKAYTTRVGDGPFPTELLCETGDRIRKQGNEYGTTTGRPRRCGWLDTVLLRFSAKANSLDGLSVMSLDVLTGLPTVKVAVAYMLDGRKTTNMPSDHSLLARAEPIYEEFPGWTQDITGARQWRDLPHNARSYVKRVSELVGVSLDLISIGPDREQTLVLRDPMTGTEEPIQAAA